MNFFNKNKKLIRIFHILLTILLVTLSLTGSDCEKALTNNGNIPAEMLGNWKLVAQSGSLIDICSDETINFQANGVAVLTCPNSTSISRNFSIGNNILTYTETSVEYNIQTLTSDSLYLEGQNVSRNLTYLKVITSNVSGNSTEASNFNNSSEERK
ncbi:MAG: hypothetical protein ABIY50_05775 [Ignavibacteria bacterium]